MNDSELKIGSVVRIHEDFFDKSFAGQFAIVCRIEDFELKDTGCYYCYVFARQTFSDSSGRFWCVGVREKDFDLLGYEIMPFLEQYQHWMTVENRLETGLKIKPNKFGMKYKHKKKKHKE